MRPPTTTTVLCVNHRSDHAIINLCNELRRPHDPTFQMIARDNAGKGLIISGDQASFHTLYDKIPQVCEVAIICRTRAPLKVIASELDQQNIGFNWLGQPKDYVSPLLALAASCRGNTLSDLLMHARTQLAKNEGKGLADVYDNAHVCFRGEPPATVYSPCRVHP